MIHRELNIIISFAGEEKRFFSDQIITSFVECGKNYGSHIPR